MTQPHPSDGDYAGPKRRLLRITELVVFGPPLAVVAVGLVGCLYGYAVLTGIRVHLFGERKRSEPTE